MENKARIRMLYEPILVNRQVYGHFDGEARKKGKRHKVTQVRKFRTESFEETISRICSQILSYFRTGVSEHEFIYAY